MEKISFGSRLVAFVLLCLPASVVAEPCRYGCAYYPEAWPESRWETDMKLMSEAGIDLVRMGEFNWSNFEPREGEFDFVPYLRAQGLFWADGLCRLTQGILI